MLVALVTPVIPMVSEEAGVLEEQGETLMDVTAIPVEAVPVVRAQVKDLHQHAL